MFMNRLSGTIAGIGLAGLMISSIVPVPSTAAQDDAAATSVDLFEEMMGIRSALRTLSRQLDDASKDEDSVKLIWSMQTHIINARQADPPTMETLPADQHGAHRAAYRKAIAEVLLEMTRMEIDLLEGRREDAKKRIAEGLFPLRESAHDAFQAID